MTVVEIAFILWQTLLRLWSGEEGLSNIILALNIFIGKACADQSEKAGYMNLMLLLEQYRKGEFACEVFLRTASRSSSASFCLPPGSSKVDRSRTLMSAHGRSWVVFAGRSHLGKGNSSAGLVAIGIVNLL